MGPVNPVTASRKLRTACLRNQTGGSEAVWHDWPAAPRIAVHAHLRLGRPVHKARAPGSCTYGGRAVDSAGQLRVSSVQRGWAGEPKLTGEEALAAGLA